MNSPTGGIHVITDGKSTGWTTKAGDVVLSRHTTKKAAIDAGRRLARRHTSPLTIHRADGSVISTKSYEVSLI